MFYSNSGKKPVDRPACWLGDPTPEAVPALCEYYGVNDIKELEKVCGDDFYAVEIIQIPVMRFLQHLTGI